MSESTEKEKNTNQEEIKEISIEPIEEDKKFSDGKLEFVSCSEDGASQIDTSGITFNEIYEENEKNEKQNQIEIEYNDKSIMPYISFQIDELEIAETSSKAEQI